LIHFSNADNERSIPSLCDGLKPSQRKILFCSEKRNLRSEIRVAQLAGYVSEHGAYHHGEASLHGTIIGMAQNFTGSNNINLLEPAGQFGSRLKGGKDSAQPRYIHTHLTSLSALIFNKLDNPVYKNIIDDGMTVEPEYYMPIIPLVLVNGTDGIGTGWSSNIPQYHPIELIANLRRLMNDEEVKEMTPWYRGFKGKVIRIARNQWITRGCYRMIGTDTIEVSELPIGVWTDNFRVLLDEHILGQLKEKKDKKGRPIKKGRRPTTKKEEDVVPLLKDYKNESSESQVKFILKFDYDILTQLMSAKDKLGITKLESTFRLVSRISCGKRLNVYDDKLKLHTFSSPEEILEHYYHIRFDFYQKRKDYMIAKLEQDIWLMSVKFKFILDVINGEVLVNNQPKAKIIEQLEKLDYPKILNSKLIKLVDLSKRKEKDRNDASYDFLIRMPIYNLTKEKIEELKRERDLLQEQLDTLKAKTIINLWEEDLEVFEKEYTAFMKEYYIYMGLNPSEYKYGKKEKIKLNLKTTTTTTKTTAKTKSTNDNISS